MKAALVISERDNVATALEPLAAGRVLDLMGRHIVLCDAIAPGHKFALVAIGEGAAVVKYGSRIGTASTPIPPGAHVHIHNVASDRGRGDRAPDAKPRGADADGLPVPHVPNTAS